MESSRPTTSTADALPVRTTTTTMATTSQRALLVFDHSLIDAEHLQYLLLPAIPVFSRHLAATNLVFGCVLPNAAPTDMRAARRGKRSIGAATMKSCIVPAPLAVRTREAAIALG